MGCWLGSLLSACETRRSGPCADVARTCLAVDEGRSSAGGCWEHRLWKRGVGYAFSAGELVVLPKPRVAFNGSRRAVQVPARSPYPDCVLPAMSVVLGHDGGDILFAASIQRLHDAQSTCSPLRTCTVLSRVPVVGCGAQLGSDGALGIKFLR